MKKSKMDTYRLKVRTFRKTIQIFVGGTEEDFYNLYPDGNYENTNGFYYFDPSIPCNIIWLKEYNIGTLVHELMHCVEGITNQIGLKMEGEAIAFMFEELFTTVMYEAGDKFKIDKSIGHFFYKHE